MPTGSEALCLREEGVDDFCVGSHLKDRGKAQAILPALLRCSQERAEAEGAGRAAIP